MKSKGIKSVRSRVCNLSEYLPGFTAEKLKSYLENSFDKVSTTAKNEFRSTKKNHHGIGLSNIRNACAKYNGSFNAHVEDNLFITELLIPIPDDKEKQQSEKVTEKTAV